ncbi:Acetyltransferase (GNAT) family protein [Theileria parva strain Muguga]|uniref:Acetyltransferase (GNAT) family protein n=1 Tax=Theileria parva strain Muguga TaxID=333668 RepID=UPI001C623631|nr:Acetyltransferase (GNAT) family protein [Theileria parva strain Muguga]EAN32070.2 Acetyltransferase (GNAT) family protein [Theileria parva strain Muguga]
MSDKESDPLDDLNRRYQELNISGKYSFNYGLLRIVDVTIHSVRQSWILLKESLPYDLSFYLDEGKKFPDFNHMKRYVKFSSLAFVSVYSAATMICEVCTPDLSPSSSKHGSGKSSKSKIKPDPFSVIIVAVSVLSNHTGIGLSVRLLEYTINKVKDAKLSKVYAIADEYNSSTIDFYTKHGFHRSSSTFPDVVSNLKVSRPDSNVSPSFIIMELPLATPETK